MPGVSWPMDEKTVRTDEWLEWRRNNELAPDSGLLRPRGVLGAAVGVRRGERRCHPVRALRPIRSRFRLIDADAALRGRPGQLRDTRHVRAVGHGDDPAALRSRAPAARRARGRGT